MKFAKLFAAVMAIAAVATACQQPEEPINPNAPKEISVSAQMYNFTRATDTAFEEGDQIGLHIVTNSAYLNNAKYTYTNGALVGAQTNYWYDDEELTADVLAYYPYNVNATYRAEGYTFGASADQSVAGAYEASDLMIAATASKPTAEAVTLPFRHAMSRINVKINNLSKEIVKAVYVADVYTAATFDLKAGTSTVSGEKTTVKAAAAGAAWTMIVAPQAAATPKMIVTTESNRQYTFNIVAATDLESGKVATANLTISKDLVGTDFTPEISDWETNDDLEFNPDENNKPGEGEGDVEDPFLSEESGLGVVGSFAASAWANDMILYTTPTEGLLVAAGVELAAYDSFKIRTVGSWEGVNVGRGSVNYIQANKYFAAVTENASDVTVEAAGTYDIYYNQNTTVIYLMTAGTDIAEATEQTESGKEPVFEEPEVTENMLFLVPNANWKSDGARFAAYFFNLGGNAWVGMVDSDDDGIYEVNIPVGYAAGDNVIFCRMNPGTTANDWSSKWNQTNDLTIPTDGKNLYTVAEGAWDNGAGTWSTK